MADYKKLTLRNTWINLLLFISPFILLFFIVNLQVTRQIKRQIYNHLSDIVQENTKSIELFLHEREIDLRSLIGMDIFSLQEISYYEEFFKAFREEKEWYDFIVVADLDGKIIFTENLNIQANISDRKYFQESSQGTIYNSGIFFSDILNRPVMILAHPILDNKKEIIGVIAVGLNLPSFYSLIFDLKMAETSELFLIDLEGTLLSPTKLGGNPLEEKAYDIHFSNPHTGETGVQTHFDYRGQEVLCAFQKIPRLNAYLVSEVDLSEALLPVSKVRRIILIIFIPFFLLLMIISNLYSIRITSFLKKLTKELEKALKDTRSKKIEVDEINRELENKIRESDALAFELKTSDEYIRNLIDSISFGLIGIDRKGCITHFNKAAELQVWNAPLKAGVELFTISPWFNDPATRDAFYSTINSGKTQQIKELEIEIENNIEYFHLAFFPIEKGNKSVSDVSLLIENITERKHIREQLVEYEKLSALSQLAMGAAHEINNPLLGISSFLELLAEDTEDQAKRDEVKFVLENVNRISETIRGLLNFARPSPPQFTSLNINSLIEDTLSFLSHQPIFRKITISKILIPALTSITADLNQIRQVLINIFINAAQSMSQGGELKVETSKVKFKELIQIDISDTGTGIDQKNKKKIFHPFFTTKKSQGTGLGLSISLSLIKNHNGNINVKSESGKGTTFSIFLPIRQKGRLEKPDEETII